MYKIDGDVVGIKIGPNSGWYEGTVNMGVRVPFKRSFKIIVEFRNNCQKLQRFDRCDEFRYIDNCFIANNCFTSARGTDVMLCFVDLNCHCLKFVSDLITNTSW